MLDRRDLCRARGAARMFKALLTPNIRWPKSLIYIRRHMQEYRVYKVYRVLRYYCKHAVQYNTVLLLELYAQCSESVQTFAVSRIEIGAS